MEQYYLKHKKSARNFNIFANTIGVSPITKKNLKKYINFLVGLDPKEITKFELSFKVKDEILNKNEIRILNLDANGYSCKSEVEYLKRLVSYKKFIWNKIDTPKKHIVFSALADISNTPLDLYCGADISEDKMSFAFWLILGGVKPNGVVEYTEEALNIFNKIFDRIRVAPKFNLSPRDILNIGFDIENNKVFYKIYYFLNSKTKNFVNNKEFLKTKKISKTLKKDYKHWFFVSERYEIKDDKKKIQRKKVYLEFLNVVGTQDRETFIMLKKIFEIISCPYDISKLKNLLSKLDARIAIISFEEDGTVTFYIRT